MARRKGAGTAGLPEDRRVPHDLAARGRQVARLPHCAAAGARTAVRCTRLTRFQLASSGGSDWSAVRTKASSTCTILRPLDSVALRRPPPPCRAPPRRGAPRWASPSASGRARSPASVAARTARCATPAPCGRAAAQSAACAAAASPRDSRAGSRSARRRIASSVRSCRRGAGAGLHHVAEPVGILVEECLHGAERLQHVSLHGLHGTLLVGQRRGTMTPTRMRAVVRVGGDETRLGGDDVRLDGADGQAGGGQAPEPAASTQHAEMSPRTSDASAGICAGWREGPVGLHRRREDGRRPQGGSTTRAL